MLEGDIMSKAIFNVDIKRALDSLLLKIPIVVPGQMFGYPAYYVNKKLFACVYEDGVGIKVPYEKARELIGKEGIVPFIPMGRREMKEWIQIIRERPEDYVKDREIFEASIEFVAALGDRRMDR